MPEKFVDQFRGLPMADLIGGPLAAVSEAQMSLAKATADFINQVGFYASEDKEAITKWEQGKAPKPVGQVRSVKFAVARPSAEKDKEERLEVDLPMLAMVKIPALSVSRVNITFDMEVKMAEKEERSKEEKGNKEGEAKIGWGPFSASVKMSGSVSTHESNTRSTDTSAKYHVDVFAEDRGTPEGLARVLDMMNGFLAPRIETVALPKKTT